MEKCKNINKIEWEKFALKIALNSNYGSNIGSNIGKISKQYRRAEVRIKRIRTINRLYV